MEAIERLGLFYDKIGIAILSHVNTDGQAAWSEGVSRK